MTDHIENILGLGVCAAKGFHASGVKAGIKASGAKDVAVIYSTVPAKAAAVFTSNKVNAASVQLSKKHMAQNSGTVQAIIMTSGNANACTGAVGLNAVNEMCSTAAEELHIQPEQVLIAQTGLIGIPLNADAAVSGVKYACSQLSAQGGADAAHAIMTTDTVPKLEVEQFEIGGQIVTAAAMAKGAAMLSPAMATMLCLITTDAAIEQSLLQKALHAALPNSFHSMVVDGCRSTNDTVFLLANGEAKNPIINDADSAAYKDFAGAIAQVCESIAMQMAQDAEGSTKFMMVSVHGARNETDARLAARAVVSSNLVKCSLAGKDPYWGRVLSEVGASGADVDQFKIDVAYGGEIVCHGGEATTHNSQLVKEHMEKRNIKIDIYLHQGNGEATAFGCDLTHGYIDENMTTS